MRLATAATSWVLRARSPAHFLISSVSVRPLRKTMPSSTRTCGSRNQPVAFRTLYRRVRISSSRATGLTSTVAGAAESPCRSASQPTAARRCPTPAAVPMLRTPAGRRRTGLSAENQLMPAVRQDLYGTTAAHWRKGKAGALMAAWRGLVVRRRARRSKSSNKPPPFTAVPRIGTGAAGK